MRAVTAMQMKQIEMNSLDYGQTYLNLMKNAGNAASNIITKKIDVKNKNVAVICGKGNNGGDGFVVASDLKQNGARVTVFLTDGEPRSQESKQMLRLAENNNANILSYNNQVLPDSFDIIVDALFGTGFSGVLSEYHAEICNKINNSNAVKVSLDIPSGINSDNNLYDINCVKPNFTVTFDSLKVCHVITPTAELCGEVIASDIGINPLSYQAISYNYELIDYNFVFNYIKAKDKDSHKGSNGKLLNVSGSHQYTGAAVLSSLAAARCGVGYVTLASTEHVCSVVSGYIPEVTYLPQKENKYGSVELADDTLPDKINSYNAVLIGCGLGNNEITEDLVTKILINCTSNIIIDADGINIISKNINLLGKAKAQIILTPHLGEMSRLTGKTIDEINNNRLGICNEFCKKHNVIIVLKGPNTIVVTPTGFCYVNRTGNAGLAKAGSGDVLAGMISSFLAQGLKPEIAAACGVFLHGAAADLTAKRLSQYFMQPSDILTDLSRIFSDNQR